MEQKEKERAKQTDSNLRWFTQDRKIQEKEGKAEVEKEVGRDGNQSRRGKETEETVWTTTTNQECHLPGQHSRGVTCKEVPGG